MQKPSFLKSTQSKVGLLLSLAGIAIVTLLVLSPIPQNPAYHHFADQRIFLGIPHALNVLSNLPFLLVGVLGLLWLSSPERTDADGPIQGPWERRAYRVFFLGVALTCLGSSYYHYAPNNHTLLWDRLPMGLAFMALFSIIIMELIHPDVGKKLLIPLLFLGVASVLYWYWSETQGKGDLRPYLLVQFYPLLALPLIILLFPHTYTHTHDLFVTIGWYVLAKVCEVLDPQIYALGGIVSGHTIKHLLAALGIFWILRMLKRRKPIPHPENTQTS